MSSAKQERLRKAGWKIGSAQDSLGLTDEETALIEMRLVLARSLKARRSSLGLTQRELAERLGSSQSRIAKMESADASVSIDLFIPSFLKLGATRHELGRVLGQKATSPSNMPS